MTSMKSTGYQRGILEVIEREHVEIAIKRMQLDGIRSRRDSRAWWIEHDGMYYPPKYAISLASVPATGKELMGRDFRSIEARRHLRKLGYKIVRKN